MKTTKKGTTTSTERIVICHHCEGYGRINTPEPDDIMGYHPPHVRPCPTCGGDGRLKETTTTTRHFERLANHETKL